MPVSKRKILISSNGGSAADFFIQLLGETDILCVRAAERDSLALCVDEEKPSAILMDLDNPQGSVLVNLCRVLVKHSVPVLLFSKTPDRNTDLVGRALKLGAVDIIQVPTDGRVLSKIQSDRIVRIINSATTMKLPAISYKEVVAVLRERQTQPEQVVIAPEPVSPAEVAKKISAVGVAISTGGPNALSRFVPSLPPDFPAPILVVQHIIPGFISNVAERLDKSCDIKVRIARDGEPVKGGTIYFAPDGMHLKLMWKNGLLTSCLDPEPVNSLFRPSADILFNSLVETCRNRCVGIIMTGMGKDGVEGLRSIKSVGGITIAQDQQSSAIYGMARVAVDQKLIDHVVPLDRIASMIYNIISENNNGLRPQEDEDAQAPAER